MKWDKAGAGVVAGLLKALASAKAPVHVIGILGLVENMPDGGAFKPGDIITTMSGQTVEIVDTEILKGASSSPTACGMLRRSLNPKLL